MEQNPFQKPGNLDTGAPATELVAGPDLSRLGALARSGALWTLGRTVTRNVINLGTTAVLARLLTPRDYGLVGMVYTLTAFLNIFSDMGLSWATVQRKELTKAQVDNLFWINVGAGTVLWGLCAAAGPALTWFYGPVELRRMAAILGASFFLSGVAVQPLALLKRQMRLKHVAVAELISIATGSACGLAVAVVGGGYWALVCQVLTLQGARALAFLVASGFRPSWFRFGQGTFGLLKFGGALALGGVFAYISSVLDRILLGRIWGAQELAYYGRAWFLMALPGLLVVVTLGEVVRPALCAVQDDTARFERVYRKAVGLLAFASMPMVMGMLAAAPEIVRFFYGPQWAQVVAPLRWLLVANLCGPVAASFGWVYVAKGRPRITLLLSAGLAALVSVTSSVGCRWGAEGVAIGRLVAGTIILGPSFWFAHSVGGLRWRSTLLVVVRPLAVASAMGAVVLVVGRVVLGLSPLWQLRLVVEVVTGVVVFLVLGCLFCRDVVRETFRSVAMLLSGGRVSTQGSTDVG